MRKHYEMTEKMIKEFIHKVLGFRLFKPNVVICVPSIITEVEERAVIDAGWMDKDRQVGQTGKTVRPELYVACGISGAIQHAAGMEGSDYIIAINKEETAPIFDIADLGIIGDVNAILPKLTEAIKKYKAEQAGK